MKKKKSNLLHNLSAKWKSVSDWKTLSHFLTNARNEASATKTSDRGNRGDRGKMKRSKAQTMAKLYTTILLIVPKR